MILRFNFWEIGARLGNKKYVKRVLYILAVSTVVLSVLGVQVIVRQIAEDERKKVQIWASAVQQKAELISYSNVFFKNIQTLSQKDMEKWAEACASFFDPKDPIEYEVARKMITQNSTIPCIITDKNLKILHQLNTDQKYKDARYLRDSMLLEYSKYPPIETYFWDQKWHIYYKDSYVFSQLQKVLDDLVGSFIDEISKNAVFAPVLVVSADEKKVIFAGNIQSQYYSDSIALEKTLLRMESQNTPIEFRLNSNEKYFIFYENSIALTQLNYIPFIFVIILLVFILLAVWVLRASKRVENEKIWVGMSRETAHQLGTPISSLMGWKEYLKERRVEDDVLSEIEKDLERLKIITDRFSKIGTIPKMTNKNIVQVVYDSISYLQPRLSKKIKFNVETPPSTVIVANINSTLIEWVLENLFKNAVDSIGLNEGLIQIQITETHSDVHISITDNGRGIPRAKQKNVFHAGYTTKSRGWGLGLTLSHRIINDYHKGKIFIKQSALNKGTTFQIVLHK